ncbi:unnamed protein product [Gongylonema pulchrum]|uniref:Cleavage and polyadenylation specificity factor subunit 2 n=1 Tax=Gongylonema pulchrum TaxID=637853 RepID=A0A183E1Q1_9BILA|nr:unnamed protein product [Gongylonema pulchrum]
MTYNLVMLSYVASSVVEFAKSQVEWMSDKVLKSFEVGRYNPFQFRHVQLCHTLTELIRVRSPKVVLVSGLDMESGFSRELFLDWCTDVKNTVIITGRSGDRTLGARLIRMAEQSAENPNGSINRNLTIEVKRRIRLDGAELKNYRAMKLAEEREATRIRLENSRRNARLEHADSSEDSDDDTVMVLGASTAGAAGKLFVASRQASTGADNGHFGNNSAAASADVTATHIAEQRSHDIMWKWEQQQKSSFFKQSKKSFPMFPYIEEKTRWDDYGEVIRPEEYMVSDTAALPPHPAESKDAGGAGSDCDEQVTLLQEEREWPSKCISQIVKMEVLCKVDFIDFEGRSDGESVKKILSQIKPKQMIIVHGSSAATRHLAQYAQQQNIVQVKDAELSWLDARITRRKTVTAAQSVTEESAEAGAGRENDVEIMEHDGVESEEKRLNNLKVASADTFCLEPMISANIPSHQAVFVNDPKLSDLKHLLSSNGFRAEFSSGVLYVNNVASIRRNEAGRFHVEGCASEDYYKIRDIVYAQFAVV